MKEEKDRLSGEDTREGMTAIISIKHGDPSIRRSNEDKIR